MKPMKFGALAVLLVPATVFAASGFDGSWKFSVDHIQPSKKPFTLLLNNGEYRCLSCTITTPQKADGTEQPLKGDSNADARTVAVIDAHTVTVIMKLHGKVVNTIKYAISADGKTLSEESIDAYGAAPTTYKAQFTRMKDPPAGAHALSGSWGAPKMLSAEGPGVMVTYAMTEDGFSASSNGQTYAAKFDDKTYPVKGDPTNTAVNVRKVSDTEVIETDSQMGKPVETMDMTVSADGKSVRVVDTEVHGHRVSTYVLTKTP